VSIYGPQLLEAFECRSTSATGELPQAVGLLRELNFKKRAACPGQCSQRIYPTTLERTALSLFPVSGGIVFLT
jgi:hypothetical protein